MHAVDVHGMHALPCPGRAGLALGDREGETHLTNTMQAALKSSLEGLFSSCALETPRLRYSAVLLGLQGVMHGLCSFSKRNLLAPSTLYFSVLTLAARTCSWRASSSSASMMMPSWQDPQDAEEVCKSKSSTQLTQEQIQDCQNNKIYIPHAGCESFVGLYTT